ncbi:hypothetical protein HY78_08490 [Rhizorhabdus wittichii DC-6]|nr:hypothetical protein HY78_08490 [Rhizorhabdus wittichii DC-6]
MQADDWCGEFILKPASDPAEFAEVFDPNLSIAPHDKVLMGQLADGTEAPMLWWHNWPGWREAFVGSAVGVRLAPIAWRPLTEAEDVFDDIPF